MTSIFYPDCEAVSPNGSFILEARSPHNGTINHQDGRAPSEDEFPFKYREHQRCFRYRLLAATNTSLISAEFGEETDHVIWERWQERGEDSPHELVVSDEGWSVIRTHGSTPELIVVSLDGQEIIRVKICGPEEEDSDKPTEPKSGRENVPVWAAKHLQSTTAGEFWSTHSRRYFLHTNERIYFVWRTSWGDRLVLDLTNAALLGEAEQCNSVLSAAMQEAETLWGYHLLSELATQTTEIQRLLTRRRRATAEPHPLLEKLTQATSAILIAGAHRAAHCIPMLRRLEEIDCPSYSTDSIAMGGDWWLEAQHFRPILHHSLRLLGQEPLGFAAYHFRLSEKKRFPMPEKIADRQARADQVRQNMAAKEVLQLLGSPDHVRKRSHEVAGAYRWSEDWEYDFCTGDQWSTFRIIWEEEGKQGRIVQIETVPTYWLHTNERESEILRF